MQTTPIAERERLVHAAHRFAQIANSSAVKLFSLLYMLDIRHFRHTGASCTGEVYHAMADGPAPATLRPLLAMAGVKLEVGISLLTATSLSGWRFDSTLYHPCALDIMHELELNYRDTPPQAVCLHDADAWWQAYTRRRGVGSTIPYEATLIGASAPERRDFRPAPLYSRSLPGPQRPQRP